MVVVGGNDIVTVVVSATRDHGFESPVLHEWLPPATPGLTWILYPTEVSVIYEYGTLPCHRPRSDVLR